MRIIDISSDLMTAPVYPGDPVPKLQKMYSVENDDDFNLSAIYAGLHNGTHIDAPSHVLGEYGKNIDEIPLEPFIGPVEIITLPDGPVTGRMVEKIFPKEAKRVILRTNENSEFFGAAAEDAAALNYELLGYDKLSMGGQDEVLFHRALLAGGTMLLEGIDLSEVTHDGEYFLIAPPVKISGAEAAFSRALLIEDYIFWASKK